MGISNIFRVSGTALNTQSVAIDTVAKNMANAQVVSNSEESAYRAQRPIFSSVLESQFDRKSNVVGVKIDSFMDSNTPIERQRMPDHPMADQDGYIYLSNVNIVEEMASMIEASRNYQSNVEVLNTSKQLFMRTLALGN